VQEALQVVEISNLSIIPTPQCRSKAAKTARQLSTSSSETYRARSAGAIGRAGSVVEATSRRYFEAYRRLTGVELAIS